MSLRYETLTDEKIVDQEILAESIPHLLHQDLAYFWMLSLPAVHRPSKWQGRIKAWKELLSLFLIGEIDLVPIEVARLPLAETLQNSGAPTPFWLVTRTTPGSDERPRKVGVTSTTVLVRPLPNFDADLARCLETYHADRRRPDELNAFAALAAKKIRELDSDHAVRLVDILHREFGVDPHDARMPQRQGRPEPLSLLRKIDWSGASEFDSIFVAVRGERPSAWAPTCRGCNTFLTSAVDAPPIDVGPGATAVRIDCRKCNEPNDVQLSDLFVWQRSQGEVVIWDVPADHQGRRPPEPNVSGIDLTFEWTFAELRGDIENRWLRLRFSGRVLARVNPAGCFFRDLLVVGPRQDFKGLPIRGEWMDALERSEIEWREQVVEFRIRLHGYPEPWSIRLSNAYMEEHSDAALGVYPDPRVVGPDWKLFRAFVANANGAVTLRSEGPWKRWLGGAVESVAGLPGFLTLSSASNPDCGSTLVLSQDSTGIASGRAIVSIDFGTSNTLVYVASPRADDRALAPLESHGCAYWIGRSKTDAPGPFLPPGRTSSDADKFVIPSAIWSGDLGQTAIRWSARSPQDGMKAVTAFKWDDRSRGRSFVAERRAYMRELLFLLLPVVCKRQGSPLQNIDIGMTFPLAFDQEQKRLMRELLGDLGNDCQELFGVRIDAAYSLSESAACVKAFGAHREGETFLIADMGGGTLDVALVTIVPDNAGGDRNHVTQIGSLRLGGEEFVTALARPSGEDADKTAWEIRDRIIDGTADMLRPNDPQIVKMLRRFYATSFEYLRTMVEAYRQTGASEEVKLVLVGNGWHLVDAFSPQRRAMGSRHVWSQYFEDVVKRLGVANVRLYSDQGLTVPTKHLAVMGALSNAESSRRRELEDEKSEAAKLPAGRDLRVGSSQISWSRLVGDGAPLSELDSSDVRVGMLSVGDGGAPMSDGWQKYLAGAFAVPSVDKLPIASEARIRERLGQGIRPTGSILAVGPLQIIVEDSWLPSLEQIK